MLSEQDQMHAHILGKLSALEATLLALIIAHPHQAGIKNAVALYLEAATTCSLFGTASDAESEIFRLAREQTFHAIFPEPLPKNVVEK